ncbi:type VI secretion system Vgr family protein [Pseudoduganella sp. R-32]|uniref:type VI secretion system Vgr family protein n=1 Tax=Pseudoduganella sp. R-32 TaxID=3404061 RepID=UPI003CEBEF9A
MKTGFKQACGLMQLTSPFGADDLLLDSLAGSEGLSELFGFTLHMRSASTSLRAAAAVGKEMTVSIGGPGGTRYISGMVMRFVQSGEDKDFALYEAELVPALWKLTLSRDRKIFSNLGVDAIIKDVLGGFGVAFESRLGKSYASREYCVQYDETAFDFISRLMEQAGICYFFTFAASGHTMVLADASSQFADCAGAAKVRFWPETGMLRPVDAVSRFAHEHRIVLQQATVSDYDFVTPDTSLEGSFQATAGMGASYEFATGHGTVDAGRALAQLQVEESQCASEVLHGDSFCYPFCAGTRFTLAGHFVSALNADFVLRRVRHTVRDDVYSNAFEAFPGAVPFRPPRQAPLPRMAGCETAMVVGPSGEEIWTDKHGRVKVRFPWDHAAADDKRAPWIRVAQAAAGKGVGAFFLPRIGHEVVISYVNGDPDRPLVTGSVYNGNNVPPATLPANQTQSILRTLSSKQGKAGNELRFEDKKDAEQLYMHAQKDMAVEIENALATTVKKGAELHTLEEGDRTIVLKKGKEVHQVAGSRELAVKGAETHANEAAFTHTVKGDYQLTIDGSLTISVKGGIKLVSDDSLALEAAKALSAKAGTELSNKAGTALQCEAGTDLGCKAGKALQLQAGLQIDHKAPIINSKADATQTVEAGAVLTLKGAMAKVN